jgi:hypothetical protein
VKKFPLLILCKICNEPNGIDNFSKSSILVCPTGLYYISECINSQCPFGYTCFGSPPSAYCCGSSQPVTCSSIDSDGSCISDANCQAGFLCDVLNQRCCPNLGENPSSQGPCIGGACAIGKKFDKKIDNEFL